MHQETLIKKLKRGNAKAQRQLYDSYAPRFLALCKRYIKDTAEAEDVLIEGFMKIYKEMPKYRNIGSFEAWMHKIMVNQCLMEIRKHHNLNVHLNVAITQNDSTLKALEYLYEEDLLAMIEELPVGCKTVFNLFVIEGYSHKEIAFKLGISDGTSKSQLNLAKKKLREKLEPTKKRNYGK